MRALVCSFVLLMALPVIALPVTAQEAEAPSTDAEYEAHLQEALADYQARRYLEAAESFRAAYALRPEPDLQYNVARSLERALRREEAVAAYDEYLSLPGTTSQMRARAMEARQSLRTEIEALARADARAAAQEQSESEPEPPETPEIEPLAPVASGGLDLAPIGWVVFGVGAATAVVGAVFGGLAIEANDSFYASTDRDEQVLLRDRVQRYALLTDILVGAGLAVGITGIILVAVSSGGDEDASAALRVTPVAGPDLAGVSVSGDF